MEAAAAESEVVSQTSLMNNLRQASLDASGELSAATQSLTALKSGVSDVTNAQSEVDAASTELEGAEKAVTESEENLQVARNQSDLAKTNMKRAQDWDVLDQEVQDSTAAAKAANDEMFAAEDELKAAQAKDLKARVDAKMDKLLEDQVDLSKKMDELMAKKRLIQNQFKDVIENKTVPEFEVVKAEIKEVQAAQDQLNAKKGPLGFREALEEEAAAEPPSPDVQYLQKRLEIKQTAQQNAFKTLNEKTAAKESLAKQIDPSYDNQKAFDQTQQNLKDAEQSNQTARQDRDLVKDKLTQAKQKLSQAKQDSADLQAKIDQKQTDVGNLNKKVDSLAQQESDATTKLQQLKDAAKQKQDEQQDSAHQRSSGGLLYRAGLYRRGASCVAERQS